MGASRRRGEVTDNEYHEVGHLLEATHLVPSPSEAHGILCGLVCGGSKDPVAAWLEHLFSDRDADPAESSEVRQHLEEYGAQAADSARDRSEGLRLLLPDEEAALLERATGVYDWVRGFLFAVGTLGVKESDLSEQGREVIRDFADLTRMDLAGLEESEENEEALMEITEFVRVAAMLIQEERNPPAPGAAGS
ncbi:YecA family protein [Imhoffiella purpurea]|uniref:YecA family protein n=1 Tax=Imhoffiella purpurea TaxID=1249627 RepID=W9VHC5_9GAMM|nr:YecA family protein [Imhoffiella purpurea]